MVPRGCHWVSVEVAASSPSGGQVPVVSWSHIDYLPPVRHAVELFLGRDGPPPPLPAELPRRLPDPDPCARRPSHAGPTRTMTTRRQRPKHQKPRSPSPHSWRSTGQGHAETTASGLVQIRVTIAACATHREEGVWPASAQLGQTPCRGSRLPSQVTDQTDVVPARGSAKFRPKLGQTPLWPIPFAPPPVTPKAPLPNLALASCARWP